MNWSAVFTVVGVACLLLVSLGVVGEAVSPSKTKRERNEFARGLAWMFIVGVICVALAAGLA